MSEQKRTRWLLMILFSLSFSCIESTRLFISWVFRNVSQADELGFEMCLLA